MHWEQWLIVICIGMALALCIRAALLRSWRAPLIMPAVALVLMAVYALGMTHWETTVHGPIRLDVVLEIPLATLFVLWGLFRLAFPGKS